MGHVRFEEAVTGCLVKVNSNSSNSNKADYNLAEIKQVVTNLQKPYVIFVSEQEVKDHEVLKWVESLKEQGRPVLTVGQVRNKIQQTKRIFDMQTTAQDITRIVEQKMQEKVKTSRNPKQQLRLVELELEQLEH